MTRLLLCLSHALTTLQEADARASLGVTEIVPMPADLRALWAAIPPERPTVTEYLQPVAAWVADMGAPGDHVLVQGDPGAVYWLVKRARHLELQPVYSTTERRVVEERHSDGTVESRRVFRHVRFRAYEPEVKGANGQERGGAA